MLFIGSGCAALIYEVVWLQLLQLAVGSTAVSLGVLLGTFMGGMCLGSLALPKYVSARQHPLRVYALLELGIGILGVVVFFGVPLVDRLYAAIVGHGLPAILLRALVAGVCLLPPTVLMGASLPAISRWIETTPEGVSWMGFFYGGNIAGAVFGCLLAGFYLLRVHDMATATFVAAAINITVALIGLALARGTHYSTPATEATQAPIQSPPGSRAVYITIALSGLCALGAEVIWTRILALMIAATVYTFSIILAVFLVGLGLGSSVGSVLSRGAVRPRVALGVCQMLLVAAIAWTAWTLSSSLPYWPIDSQLAKSPWFNFQIDLMRCVWAVFPAACLWGASFPLALAAVASRGQDPGKLVGTVYAANTIGAIVGSLGFSVILIPWIGTQNSQRVLIALAAFAALIMLAPLLWSSPAAATSDKEPGEPTLRKRAAVYLAASIVVAILLVRGVSSVPWTVIAYGRRAPTTPSPGKALYVGEGMNSSIVVSELNDGKIYFHVSGKVEATTESYDMRLQRMLGHIPALLHPRPRSVLVVGFGAGVTAGSFVPYPEIERIVICEIEPLIPPATTRYFGRQNYDVIHDPRVEIVYDDARHFILTTKEKFDVITSDPIHPWVKGTSTLYSTEYFELCKRHLNPGGVITQWVPLYETDVPTVKSELATFFQVFPNGTVWGNDINGDGYDSVLLGQADPSAKINVDELQQRLDRPEHEFVARSLFDVGFRSAVDLLGTYAGRDSDLAPWLEGAAINQDLNLRLQYLAGMGLNFNRPIVIYDQILRYRRLPGDLFVGSEPALQALQAALTIR